MFSMLDLCPRGLKVEVRAALSSMAGCASALHVGDPAVPFSRLCNVIASRAVTLLTLHALKPRSFKFRGRGCRIGARRVAVEAAWFKLDPSRWKRIGGVRVRAVGPLHILGDVTLAASRAGDVDR